MRKQGQSGVPCWLTWAELHSDEIVQELSVAFCVCLLDEEQQCGLVSWTTQKANEARRYWLLCPWRGGKSRVCPVAEETRTAAGLGQCWPGHLAQPAPRGGKSGRILVTSGPSLFWTDWSRSHLSLPRHLTADSSSFILKTKLGDLVESGDDKRKTETELRSAVFTVALPCWEGRVSSW